MVDAMNLFLAKAMTMVPMSGTGTTGGAGEAGGDAWALDKFLKSATDKVKEYGGLLISLIGVGMVIYAVWLIAKHLTSGGRSQTSWGNIAILFILGGVFMAGGWQLVGKMATGQKDTIENLGKGKGSGTIIWMAPDVKPDYDHLFYLQK